MSSVEENNVILNYQDRKVDFNKKDYQENKKEKLLFNYFEKNARRINYGSTEKLDILSLIDKDKSDNKKEITLKDIEIFCSDEKLQKKGITPDDVINFLNKTKKLNPTAIEREYNELCYPFKDENGENIMGDKEFEEFGFNKSSFSNEIIDENKNIKPGFELFDLNDDGVLDSLEEKYLDENKISDHFGNNVNVRVKGLHKHLINLDKAGSSDQTTDGIITKADKQNLYNNLIEEYKNEQLEQLNNSQVKDENEEQVITDAIRKLYKDKMEISFDDVLDENNNLKAGCKIFDLNGDGKLDELEKSYWANGGHLNLNGKNTVKIEDFLATINELDKSQSLHMYHRKDGVINQREKQNVYKVLEGAKFLLDTLDKHPDVFSEKLKEKYTELMKTISLYEADFERGIDGYADKDTAVSIKTSNYKPEEIADTLIHELTHCLLYEKLTPLQQEVVTFYMNKKFESVVHLDSQSQVRHDEYQHRYDYLKRNTELSDLEIAKKAFLETLYDKGYDGRYNDSSRNDIDNTDYSVAGEFFE